jgi:alpha-ribazole phosphatase
MRLWLLRHAQVLVPTGVCYGVSDVAADVAATQQAAQAFAALPAPASVLWSSPSGRAWQLACALHQERVDLKGPKCNDQLREMDFGQWEMQPWTSIPSSALDAWTADFGAHRFGGKESAQDVIDRVALALEQASDAGGADCIWVTHAGVIRAVQFLLTGQRQITAVQDWPRHAPDFGQWIAVDL